jgi:hypothetical protein
MFGTEYHREELQSSVSLQPADTCVGNTSNEDGTACDVERKLAAFEQRVVDRVAAKKYEDYTLFLYFFCHFFSSEALVHPRGYDPEWICAHTHTQTK